MKNKPYIVHPKWDEAGWYCRWILDIELVNGRKLSIQSGYWSEGVESRPRSELSLAREIYRDGFFMVNGVCYPISSMVSMEITLTEHEKLYLTESWRKTPSVIWDSQIKTDPNGLRYIDHRN